MSDAWEVLSALHLAFTGMMAGVIWMVHVVHYPLFARVGDATYVDYQREHMMRITRLLVIPWGGEVLLGAAIFLAAPTTQLRLLAFAAGVLQVAVVAITGEIAAPTHGRLLDGFDAAEHVRLLRADLLRAVLWTARLVLAVVIVVT